MNGQDVIEVEPTEAPVRGGSRFEMRSSMGFLPRLRFCLARMLRLFKLWSRSTARDFSLEMGCRGPYSARGTGFLAAWPGGGLRPSSRGWSRSWTLRKTQRLPSNSRPSNLAAGCSLIAVGRPRCMGRESIAQNSRGLWYLGDSHDPDQPERLVLQLEQTVAGCRWLLREWSEIRSILENGLGLQSREKLVISRLLGMQPINVVHKPKLAKIFIACHLIEPQYKAAFREMRCELDDPHTGTTTGA